MLLVVLMVARLLASLQHCVLELVHPSGYPLLHRHRGQNPFSQRFD
jgi:hypothetical protein